ncbi:MAG TPA: hypothetical protein VF815_32610 [Myxococcaceae bacterium]|jgi:hypothetical protein
MRCFQAAVSALLIMVLPGCPSEFGKDGRVDQAVSQDTQANVLSIKGCSQKQLREACSPGKENSDECRKCKLGGAR